MLSPALRSSILIAIAIYFVILIMLLKQKRLTLRYTLLWLFSGLVMLMFVLFPQILHNITSLLGIEVESNALFAILFFCILVIMMSITSIISKQNNYIKRLIQYTAQLEKRIRDLEKTAGK